MKLERPFKDKPDFERFRRAITTREPGPVPVGDIFADPETIGNFLGVRVRNPMLTEDADPQEILKEGIKFLNHSVRFCCETGWDYVFSFSLLNFPGFRFRLADNTSTEVKDGKRAWLNDNRGPIMSWDDFERYRWPKDAGTINLGSRYLADTVPEGMKVMVIPGGVFEWTTWLMGLVPFSYALVDQPDLVEAVIQRVSEAIYTSVADLMDEPKIGGLFMGDDLGYNTGTMVSPQVLRDKFLPHTRRVVDLVHEAGKVFVFHSCGNMYALMDDIYEMGVDAKHSYEDKIMPVEEAYQRWGRRLGIIGGVDMNLLAKGREEEVRRRTREILDACAPGGHYVLGTGNSVANYVPLGNYLAMLAEGRKWNQEHFGREY